MSFGSRIKEQRKIKQLTQPQLAEKLKLSLNSVKQLETNRVKPSIETLEKLMELFQVSADYLLGKEGRATMVGDVQKELLDIFPNLSEENQEFVLELIRKIIKE